MARKHDPKSVLRAALVVVAALVTVSVVSVGVTAVTMPGCELCHLQGDFETETRASTHAGIECGTCHGADSFATRFTFASRTIFGMVVPLVPAEGRSVSNVEDRVCLSCHANILAGVTVSKGYRIDHTPCMAGRRCVDCHSNTAHGESVRWLRIAEMDTCLECHPSDEVRRTCEMCHDPHTPRERLGVGVWQITHGATWPETHGMGDNTTCTGCHVRAYCEPCHGIPLPHDRDYLRIHGARALADSPTCDRCHADEYCDGCHGIAMPHGVHFVRDHGDIAETARHEQDAACARCHAETDCSECHETHDRHLELLGQMADRIRAGGE